jgi:hypothetical protein
MLKVIRIDKINKVFTRIVDNLCLDTDIFMTILPVLSLSNIRDHQNNRTLF